MDSCARLGSYYERVERNLRALPQITRNNPDRAILAIAGIASLTFLSIPAGIIAGAATPIAVAMLKKRTFCVTDLTREELRVSHGATPDSLRDIQALVEKRQLSLHVAPKKPVSGSYEPDAKHANEFIGQLREPYSSIAKQVFSQHITMDDFEIALQESVEKLKKRLPPNSAYAIGITHGKSTQWVAALALKYLGKEYVPSSECSLGSSQGTIGLSGSIPKAESTVSKVKEHALVIFDDASYSGMQLAGVVGVIGQTFKSSWSKRKVYLVVPLLTTYAQARVSKAIEEESKVDFELITSSRKISTISEVFPKEQGKLLELTYVFPCSEGATLTTCDWRRPDRQSTLEFPKYFFYPPGMEAEGHQVDKTGRKFFPKEIIPQEIPRPYGLSVPKDILKA